MCGVSAEDQLSLNATDTFSKDINLETDVEDDVTSYSENSSSDNGVVYNAVSDSNVIVENSQAKSMSLRDLETLINKGSGTIDLDGVTRITGYLTKVLTVL